MTLTVSSSSQARDQAGRARDESTAVGQHDAQFAGPRDAELGHLCVAETE